MEIQKHINSFKTKYKEGFTQEEIEELLESYPSINRKKFDDALMGITCLCIDEKLVIYPWDIEKALRCGIENRDLKFSEFD